MVLVKLDSDMQKNEPGPLSYTIHKNKLKMDERPKCKTGSIKILEKKAGKNLFDLGRSNFLLNTSPEARETKAKMNYWELIKINSFWGTWVAQLVKRPTSAQVMISQFVGSSPASGSVLTAHSLEPASDSVSPSLSAPPPFMLCLSLSQK